MQRQREAEATALSGNEPADDYCFHMCATPYGLTDDVVKRAGVGEVQTTTPA